MQWSVNLFLAHVAGTVRMCVLCDGVQISKSVQFTYVDPDVSEERRTLLVELPQRLAYLQSCLKFSADTCVSHLQTWLNFVVDWKSRHLLLTSQFSFLLSAEQKSVLSDYMAKWLEFMFFPQILRKIVAARSSSAFTVVCSMPLILGPRAANQCYGRSCDQNFKWDDAVRFRV